QVLRGQRPLQDEGVTKDGFLRPRAVHSHRHLDVFQRDPVGAGVRPGSHVDAGGQRGFQQVVGTEPPAGACPPGAGVYPLPSPTPVMAGQGSCPAAGARTWKEESPLRHALLMTFLATMLLAITGWRRAASWFPPCCTGP